MIFSNAPDEYTQPVRDFGEKVGIAFQLLDDVIDLAPSGKTTGKVPGTDLRAGVPTMPSLLLKRSDRAEDHDLAARIEAGQARVQAGEDPSILDAEIDELRDSAATEQTRRLAEQWSADAKQALEALPKGAVREALVRFADAVVDRAS